MPHGYDEVCFIYLTPQSWRGPHLMKAVSVCMVSAPDAQNYPRFLFK